MSLPSVPSNVRAIMIGVATSWVAKRDPEFFQLHTRTDIALTIDHLFDIISSLLTQLDLSPREFFVPVVLYCDRFIKRHGIKHNQLFNLLLGSTLLTAKFWGESVLVNNKRIASVFHYRLADLNVIERRFMAGLEYRFSLTKTDVNNFIFEAAQEATLTPPPIPSLQTCASRASSSSLLSSSPSISSSPSLSFNELMGSKTTACVV
jgi:hypothetical protein